MTSEASTEGTNTKREDDDENDTKTITAYNEEKQPSPPVNTTSGCTPQSVKQPVEHSTRIPRNPDRKRHGARNQHKSKIFVTWLLETFPQLKSSSPPAALDNNEPYTTLPTAVVDVAGGKGELAVRLCMCHQIRVTMVDPRPADPSHCYQTLVLPKLPKKWQERFAQQQQQHAYEQQQQQQQKSSNGESWSSFLEQTLQGRFQQLVMPFTDKTVHECLELQQAIQESCLLIGMHADGATEAIVNAALEYNKPFVVVPCCVFPNLYRQRFVEESSSSSSGTTVRIAVRTHEQFCQYLLQKDPRFRMSNLPFEGRNVAIWWNGKELVE